MASVFVIYLSSLSDELGSIELSNNSFKNLHDEKQKMIASYFLFWSSIKVFIYALKFCYLITDGG